MAEYAKFIDAIDSFDSYSQKVIENCEDFIQTATMVGSKIGDVIGKGAGFASSYIDDNNTKGAVTKVGLSLVSTFAQGLGEVAGGAIGEWRRNSKYKAATKKIREDGLNWKTQCFELIPHSIELCKNRIGDSKKEVEILREEILSSSLDSSEDLEIYSDKLRSCIQHLYQAEYRLALADKIIFYFDNFENQLTDLESFAYWYQESVIVNKIECYKKCYEKVYYSIIKKINNGSNQQKLIENIFHILDSKVPILPFDSDGKHPNHLSIEVSRYITEEAKHKKFEPWLPDMYYETEGFKQMVNVFSKSFYRFVLPKYKKIRNLLLTLPALIITAIYSVISIIGIFSFGKIIKWNINEYFYIPIVFIIVEIIFLIVVKIIKSKRLSYLNLITLCLKYNEDEFANDAYNICKEYAEKEKNIDEDELKSIEQNSHQDFITDDNGEKISDDDFLNSIINK